MEESTKKKLQELMAGALREEYDIQEKKNQMKDKNTPFLYPPQEEIIITGEDIEKIRESRNQK